MDSEKTNIPQGIDPNKISKVNFNKFNEIIQPTQAQQVPLPPPSQQVPPPPSPSQQVPPQAQPLPQQSPQINNEVVTKVAKLHPVLSSLIDQFGLKKDNVLENKVFFDNDPLNPAIIMQSDYEESLETWALQEGQLKAKIDGEAEGLEWYQTLLAALSVVSFNGVQVYTMFEIELFDNEKLRLYNNKYNVSERIRKLCASQLARLLVTDLKGFAEKILTFYTSKLQRFNLKSTIDTEKKGQDRYVCPETDCSETFIDTPHVNKLGKTIPYFCRLHGVHMVGVSEVGEQKAPLS